MSKILDFIYDLDIKIQDWRITKCLDKGNNIFDALRIIRIQNFTVLYGLSASMIVWIMISCIFDDFQIGTYCSLPVFLTSVLMAFLYAIK